MSDLKRVFAATFAIAIVLFLIPLFAMFGLAVLGATIVMGLIGSAALAWKAKQRNQSKFAKAYTGNRCAR